jgi:hypothetical protein
VHVLVARVRSRRDLWFPGLLMLAWGGGVLYVVLWVAEVASYDQLQFGNDSRAYWLAWRGDAMYDQAPTTLGAYLYSPAFAHAIWPLAQLPWPMFSAIWAAGLTAAVVWLVWPLRWYFVVPLVLLASQELVLGNIRPWFALVVVLGFRAPALWALPLLTKITPGVGLLWFVGRGQWRRLAVAVGTTLVLAALSFALSPELWREWLEALQRWGGEPASASMYPRYVAAVVVVLLGARLGRPELVPVGVLLGSPLLGAVAFTILLAVPRLIVRSSTHRADALTEGPTALPDGPAG